MHGESGLFVDWSGLVSLRGIVPSNEAILCNGSSARSSFDTCRTIARTESSCSCFGEAAPVGLKILPGSVL